MKPIRIITWIITGIFALLFLISWGNALGVETRYGSPGTSLPYVLGLLFGCGLIPGVFWLITYLVEKKQKQ